MGLSTASGASLRRDPLPLCCLDYRFVLRNNAEGSRIPPGVWSKSAQLLTVADVPQRPLLI